MAEERVYIATVDQGMGSGALLITDLLRLTTVDSLAVTWASFA